MKIDSELTELHCLHDNHAFSAGPSTQTKFESEFKPIKSHHRTDPTYYWLKRYGWIVSLIAVIMTLLTYVCSAQTKPDTLAVYQVSGTMGVVAPLPDARITHVILHEHFVIFIADGRDPLAWPVWSLDTLGANALQIRTGAFKLLRRTQGTLTNLLMYVGDKSEPDAIFLSDRSRKYIWKP